AWPANPPWAQGRRCGSTGGALGGDPGVTQPAQYGPGCRPRHSPGQGLCQPAPTGMGQAQALAGPDPAATSGEGLGKPAAAGAADRRTDQGPGARLALG